MSINKNEPVGFIDNEGEPHLSVEGLKGGMLYRDPSHPLKVWYGTLPESNGKSNWTVMLYTGDYIWDGFTIHQSEYEDRARYDYDTLRYMLGEIDTKPCILDYDADLKSSYDETFDDKWYMP